MGLADRIAAELKPAPPKFDNWIKALNETDRAALLNACANPAMTNASLIRVIRAEGGSISREGFKEWRETNGTR